MLLLNRLLLLAGHRAVSSSVLVLVEPLLLLLILTVYSLLREARLGVLPLLVLVRLGESAVARACGDRRVELVTAVVAPLDERLLLLHLWRLVVQAAAHVKSALGRALPVTSLGVV